MVVACICLAVSTALALCYVIYLKGKCNFFINLARTYAKQIKEFNAERKLLNAIFDSKKNKGFAEEENELEDNGDNK